MKHRFCNFQKLAALIQEAVPFCKNFLSGSGIFLASLLNHQTAENRPYNGHNRKASAVPRHNDPAMKDNNLQKTDL